MFFLKLLDAISTLIYFWVIAVVLLMIGFASYIMYNAMPFRVEEKRIEMCQSLSKQMNNQLFNYDDESWYFIKQSATYRIWQEDFNSKCR